MDALTRLSIKNKALSLGFTDVGFSPITPLEEKRKPFQQWLDNGYNAGMEYLANHFEKRLDPSLMVDNAKSVVSLIHNYYPPVEQPAGTLKIARYAYGEDYHDVIKTKLSLLFDFIKENHFPSLEGRLFTDSAPVMERAWAVKGGLGWIGKNSLLINRQHGSFFFIAELITNLVVDEPAEEVNNYCGKCTRCVDACPTNALSGSGLLDANRCISYLTIENKGEIPDEFIGKLDNRIFGCDICQEVCPWNRRPIPHNEAAFLPPDGLLEKSVDEWKGLTESEFGLMFKKSAIKRAKYKGLMRNISFVTRAGE